MSRTHKPLDWQEAKKWAAAFNAIGRSYYNQSISKEEIQTLWRERTGKCLTSSMFALLPQRQIVYAERKGRTIAYKFVLDSKGEVNVSPLEMIKMYDLDYKAKLAMRTSSKEKSKELPQTLKDKVKSYGYICISLEAAKKLGIEI